MKYALIAILSSALFGSAAFAANASIGTCESADKKNLIVIKELTWDPKENGPVNASGKLIVLKLNDQLTYDEVTVAGLHQNMVYNLNDGHSDYTLEISDLVRDEEEKANQVRLTPKKQKTISFGCSWM